VGATLKSRLPEISAEIRPRVSAAVKAGATRISERAKARAPVLAQSNGHRRPGALRDSIAVRRAGPAAYRVEAGADGAFYAGFVERGTRFMDAEPYLIPSAEESRPEVEFLVEASLREL